MPSPRKQVNVRLDDETDELLNKLIERYSRISSPVSASWVVNTAIRQLARAEGVQIPAKKVAKKK